MTAKRTGQRGNMAAAAVARTDPDAAPIGSTAVRTADARVTLNLPAAMLRDVERWALAAAETLVLPRVSTQNALRAMIRACLADDEASSAALAQVRQEHSQP